MKEVSLLTPEDTYSDTQIAQRRDEALRRALNTPPQPKHGKVKESNRPKSDRSGASSGGKPSPTDEGS